MFRNFCLATIVVLCLQVERLVQCKTKFNPSFLRKMPVTSRGYCSCFTILLPFDMYELFFFRLCQFLWAFSLDYTLEYVFVLNVYLQVSLTLLINRRSSSNLFFLGVSVGSSCPNMSTSPPGCFFFLYQHTTCTLYLSTYEVHQQFNE